MASSDRFSITVDGKQTHGAAPWLGVDPIVTAAQVVLGLQTIVSRQVDITREPAVVTVGMINGGVRENIIPDSVEMRGTIRTFDEEMRDDIHERVTTLAEVDRPGLARQLHGLHQQELPGDRQRPGADRGDGCRRCSASPATARLQLVPKVTGAEDFSFFQQVVPGLFFFLGVGPPGQDPRRRTPNHSPRFFADEAALLVGVRALSHVACDFLEARRAAG